MSKLGNYEMVTSLSENTINGYFDFMFSTLGQIRDVWSCRVKKNNKLDITAVVIDEDYDSVAANPSYEEVNAKFTKAFAAARLTTYMEGFIAQIRSPYITIQQNQPRKVSFNIPFEKGRLNRTFVGAKSEELDLGGIVYVFDVELSRIRYSNVKDISNPIAAENLSKYIDDATQNTPLTPDEFTLEKLFLNFETATFVADSARTEFPEGWKGSTVVWLDFQKLLQTYFVGPGSSFKGSDHPYVLGYGVTTPNLAERGPAIFQPKKLDFSTSFVPASGTVQDPAKVKGDGKKCSLNYLMTVDKAPPEDTTTTGVMNSLLSEHDLLGIDYGLFYDRYLELAFDKIVDQLTTTVKDLNAEQKNHSAWPGYKVDGKEEIKAESTFKVTRDDDDELRFRVGDAIVNVSSYKEVTEREAHGTPGGAPVYTDRTRVHDYRKKITAKPTAGITFPEDKKLHASILRIVLEFMEITEYSYGTNLKARTTQDEAGLHIDLYPGAKGDMLVRINPYGNYVPPRLLWGDLEAVAVVNDAISGDFYAQLRLPTFQEELKSRLEVGLRSLPKVVLPISNVYAYKSVGYIKHGADETKSVITFQSTYALQGAE